MKNGCIFCGDDDGPIVISENGWNGKKCSRCGLIYISPRPSADEINDLYGHDNANISAAPHISAAVQKRLYARHHLKIIQKYIKYGDLLELGAGAGFFLDESRMIGFNPYAIELNPTQANFIRKLNIPCEETGLNRTTFNGKKFDVIYHCDVVSHFYDPVTVFKQTNEAMRKNAFLIFETGNLGEVRQKYLKSISNFQYPDHLFFFGANNLVQLLEMTGFSLVKIYRFSISPQLLATKALLRGKGLIKKLVHIPENGKLEKQDTSKNRFNTLPHPSAFGERIKNVLAYFNYVLRYKIGFIAPKRHRPQTMIIVAQKRESI